MKHGVIFFISLWSVAGLADSGTVQSQACDKITCSDMAPKERYHCLDQKKICHRRALNVLVEEWKKDGIERNRRDNVVGALEGALKQNREVITRLEHEIGELKNDISEIEAQLKSVKKLKIKN